MKLKTNCLIAFFALMTWLGTSQEGIPIYSDYLTDNYYLIHPSMAGVANCAKIRVTARQQWFGVDDAPNLQTVSAHGRLGDSPSAIGGILFNDSNGYHATVGGYASFAYHIMFSRNEIDLNMLSFGINAGFLQYKLDETEFLAPGDFDQLVAGIEQSATNFNIDFGFSYHFIDFYAHFTAKNILKNEGINFNEQGFEFDNLRTYLLSTGYVFSNIGSEWSYEPSLMYMYRDATQESTIDVNFKAYKEMDFGKVWGGLSYRRSLDGAEFVDGSSVSSQKLQYITPFLGVDYDSFVFAYTYSYQANTVNFNTGGFHQLTLGYNFNCRREKFECNCPAVN
ncbi:MAG: type IX secretion system membrane protein PorP/SprF [Winogradskyella sp.]|nr:type IX secretion system membrane protein PorP/SprF [Winogradskyella sp.]MBT8375240.1 type IX secretion system membrane protein PorP/SprF [Bacteroidia bacterium]NNC45060.1 type IX secretion system membrane protein PorP/SprF [Winogradskyella sp.]NNF86716.1 type IX secretion system membrane protein PorP/SprF [Winogradskyella sp.]NNL81888.1 type IX secretion system membrane protein PorP/SprF [Winogradskyella sp.]